MSSDVVPEHELARRRAVLQFAECASTAVGHLMEALRGLRDAGAAVTDIVDLVYANLEPRDADALEVQKPLLPAVFEALFSADGQIMNDHGDKILSALSISTGVMQAVKESEKRNSPLDKVIGRLFDDAPKLEHGDGKPVEGQAPAIPEVAIVLRSGHAVQGAMSLTPEGTYRVLSPGELPTKNGKKRVMIESFFEPSDVECIAVMREIEMSAGGSIIVGRS